MVTLFWLMAVRTGANCKHGAHSRQTGGALPSCSIPHQNQKRRISMKKVVYLAVAMALAFATPAMAKGVNAGGVNGNGPNSMFGKGGKIEVPGAVEVPEAPEAAVADPKGGIDAPGAVSGKPTALAPQ
jgi:hypothetical protein